MQESAWWVNLLTQVGLSVRQRPLIWHKSGQPGISDVYTSFLPAYEAILWAFKPDKGGQKRLFSRPIPESQAWPRQPGTYHENEKPVEMLATWIESSSEVNEIVLDCFAGGGSTLASAYAAGRYYIGIENDELNYVKCIDRMKVLEESKEVEIEDADEG
jgi:DNA modification methylase